MNYDLLTIGDCAVDQFLKIHDASLHCDIRHKNCEIAFKYGEKIQVEEFRSSAAGNSVNVAVGAATMGIKTAIYTETGDDFGAQIILDKLKEKKVLTDFVVKNKAENTNIHPIIMFQGERTIFSYHSQRHYSIKEWKEPKFIYYTSIGDAFKNFEPQIVKYMEEHPNVILAFNPGSAQIKAGGQSFVEILKQVDVLFVNKEEAKHICGHKTNTEIKIENLHDSIIKMGVKLSVITDSLNGSSVSDGVKVSKLGICDIGKRVDKTGAGDAYAAGFVSAMMYGRPADEAMKWGTINSASCITVIGSTEGLATKTDIERLIKEVTFSQAKL
ncbi:carbohydrate kinase family protein [candidate division WWE3 bacterium]|nr:carbohydrate kinase family protein [candidate division WWE3 bacterium]